MALRQMRFLGGVVGHDVSKIQPRCAACGRVHQAQPSAARLSGALPPDVPAPPSLFVPKPAPPSSQIQMPAPPRPSTLGPVGETVPSPSFDSFADAVKESRTYR